MKRTLLIILLGMALTACGGGGSETNGAAKPPAPEAPQNPGNGGGGGNSGGGNEVEEPAPEPVQSLSCSPSPKSAFAAPGSQVTATFKFSQPYSGPAKVFSGVTGLGGAIFPVNIMIDGAEHKVTQTVPDEGKYLIQLNVDGIGLSAKCSWNIGYEVVLGL